MREQHTLERSSLHLTRKRGTGRKMPFLSRKWARGGRLWTCQPQRLGAAPAENDPELVGKEGQGRPVSAWFSD